jgi:trehalose/maltose hydrolase-like predicted phosphorylase
MHAIVAARLGDVELATRYFEETAATDLADTRGGSAGGVRIAALGGLWQTVVFGFVGFAIRHDGIALDPHLPGTWRSVRLRVHWRGRRVHVHLEHATRTLTAMLEIGEPLMLHVGGSSQQLRGGDPVHVEWLAPGR